ncbi:hypothetical protein PPERSA_09327 [Pseudocohnilembus persalinus]|uniref:CHAT domain-containing protein n=1 Tax=Pseudocohnilembus persalinus TaxID=266149 RepID=A0A0V0QXL1_PSEPJ|nr:hypothetical protein PPERSA_09327 [Pseudocohnilembus persalinus]|eukprot:KRX07113.1 hypothetical protein PPERSA_09327 [Pseudocohnilembus persalinus]
MYMLGQIDIQKKQVNQFFMNGNKNNTHDSTFIEIKNLLEKLQEQLNSPQLNRVQLQNSQSQSLLSSFYSQSNKIKQNEKQQQFIDEKGDVHTRVRRLASQSQADIPKVAKLPQIKNQINKKNQQSDRKGSISTQKINQRYQQSDQNSNNYSSLNIMDVLYKSTNEQRKYNQEIYITQEKLWKIQINDIDIQDFDQMQNGWYLIYLEIQEKENNFLKPIENQEKQIDKNEHNNNNERKIQLAILYADPSCCFQKNDKQRLYQPSLPVNYQNELKNFKQILHYNCEPKKSLLKYEIKVANKKNLQKIFIENPSIIHFSCHGDYIKELQSFVLYIENDDSSQFKLTTNDLETYLNKSTMQIQLAFINACHSYEIGKMFSNYGVRNVIAVHSQFKIEENAAQKFSEVFYQKMLSSDNKNTISDQIIKKSFDYAKSFTTNELKSDCYSCCCAHDHDDQCKWYQYAMREGFDKAHQRHLPSQQCTCQEGEKKNQLIHNIDMCDWAQEFQEEFLSHDFSLNQEDEQNLCCCQKEHDLDLKFQLLQKSHLEEDALELLFVLTFLPGGLSNKDLEQLQKSGLFLFKKWEKCMDFLLQYPELYSTDEPLVEKIKTNNQEKYQAKNLGQYIKKLCEDDNQNQYMLNHGEQDIVFNLKEEKIKITQINFDKITSQNLLQNFRVFNKSKVSSGIKNLHKLGIVSALQQLQQNEQLYLMQICESCFKINPHENKNQGLIQILDHTVKSSETFTNNEVLEIKFNILLSLSINNYHEEFIQNNQENQEHKQFLTDYIEEQIERLKQLVQEKLKEMNKKVFIEFQLLTYSHFLEALQKESNILTLNLNYQIKENNVDYLLFEQENSFIAEKIFFSDILKHIEQNQLKVGNIDIIFLFNDNGVLYVDQIYNILEKMGCTKMPPIITFDFLQNKQQQKFFINYEFEYLKYQIKDMFFVNFVQKIYEKNIKQSFYDAKNQLIERMQDFQKVINEECFLKYLGTGPVIREYEKDQNKCQNIEQKLSQFDINSGELEDLTQLNKHILIPQQCDIQIGRNSALQNIFEKINDINCKILQIHSKNSYSSGQIINEFIDLINKRNNKKFKDGIIQVDMRKGVNKLKYNIFSQLKLLSDVNLQNSHQMLTGKQILIILKENDEILNSNKNQDQVFENYVKDLKELLKSDVKIIIESRCECYYDNKKHNKKRKELNKLEKFFKAQKDQKLFFWVNIPQLSQTELNFYIQSKTNMDYYLENYKEKKQIIENILKAVESKLKFQQESKLINLIDDEIGKLRKKGQAYFSLHKGQKQSKQERIQQQQQNPKDQQKKKVNQSKNQSINSKQADFSQNISDDLNQSYQTNNNQDIYDFKRSDNQLIEEINNQDIQNINSYIEYGDNSSQFSQTYTYKIAHQDTQLTKQNSLQKNFVNQNQKKNDLYQQKSQSEIKTSKKNLSLCKFYSQDDKNKIYNTGDDFMDSYSSQFSNKKLSNAQNGQNIFNNMKSLEQERIDQIDEEEEEEKSALGQNSHSSSQTQAMLNKYDYQNQNTQQKTDNKNINQNNNKNNNNVKVNNFNNDNNNGNKVNDNNNDNNIHDNQDNQIQNSYISPNSSDQDTDQDYDSNIMSDEDENQVYIDDNNDQFSLVQNYSTNLQQQENKKIESNYLHN